MHQEGSIGGVIKSIPMFSPRHRVIGGVFEDYADWDRSTQCLHLNNQLFTLTSTEYQLQTFVSELRAVFTHFAEVHKQARTQLELYRRNEFHCLLETKEEIEALYARISALKQLLPRQELSPPRLYHGNWVQSNLTKDGVLFKRGQQLWTKRRAKIEKGCFRYYSRGGKTPRSAWPLLQTEVSPIRPLRLRLGFAVVRERVFAFKLALQGEAMASQISIAFLKELEAVSWRDVMIAAGARPLLKFDVNDPALKNAEVHEETNESLEDVVTLDLNVLLSTPHVHSAGNAQEERKERLDHGPDCMASDSHSKSPIPIADAGSGEALVPVLQALGENCGKRERLRRAEGLMSTLLRQQRDFADRLGLCEDHGTATLATSRQQSRGFPRGATPDPDQDSARHSIRSPRFSTVTELFQALDAMCIETYHRVSLPPEATFRSQLSAVVEEEKVEEGAVNGQFIRSLLRLLQYGMALPSGSFGRGGIANRTTLTPMATKQTRGSIAIPSLALPRSPKFMDKRYSVATFNTRHHSNELSSSLPSTALHMLDTLNTSSNGDCERKTVDHRERMEQSWDGLIGSPGIGQHGSRRKVGQQQSFDRDISELTPSKPFFPNMEGMDHKMPPRTPSRPGAGLRSPSHGFPSTPGMLPSPETPHLIGSAMSPLMSPSSSLLSPRQMSFSRKKSVKNFLYQPPSYLPEGSPLASPFSPSQRRTPSLVSSQTPTWEHSLPHHASPMVVDREVDSDQFLRTSTDGNRPGVFPHWHDPSRIASKATPWQKVNLSEESTETSSPRSVTASQPSTLRPLVPGASAMTQEPSKSSKSIELASEEDAEYDNMQDQPLAEEGIFPMEDIDDAPALYMKRKKIRRTRAESVPARYSALEKGPYSTAAPIPIPQQPEKAAAANRNTERADRRHTLMWSLPLRGDAITGSGSESIGHDDASPFDKAPSKEAQKGSNATSQSRTNLAKRRATDVPTLNVRSSPPTKTPFSHRAEAMLASTSITSASLNDKYLFQPPAPVALNLHGEGSYSYESSFTSCLTPEAPRRRGAPFPAAFTPEAVASDQFSPKGSRHGHGQFGHNPPGTPPPPPWIPTTQPTPGESDAGAGEEPERGVVHNHPIVEALEYCALAFRLLRTDPSMEDPELCPLHYTLDVPTSLIAELHLSSGTFLCSASLATCCIP